MERTLGLLQFLTDPNDPQAAVLRDNFVFKIVPMLNPDGVVNGNYRCSLEGCDLNRRWLKPSRVPLSVNVKELHPTVYHTKKLVKELHKERELALFCDLHGHSRSYSAFMYGCRSLELPESTRIYPYILSKLNGFFSFSKSQYDDSNIAALECRGPENAQPASPYSGSCVTSPPCTPWKRPSPAPWKASATAPRF
jgi:hypothetical protein